MSTCAACGQRIPKPKPVPVSIRSKRIKWLKAWGLHRAGWSYQRIAERFGLTSYAGGYRLVQRAMPYLYRQRAKLDAATAALVCR